MKKRMILASAIGLAGGLAYLFARGIGAKGPKDSRDTGEQGADSSRTNVEAPREDNSQLRDYETDQFAGDGSSEEHELDDRGTDQAHASQMLRSIRDQAFEGSDEKLALALGRPTDEIERWASGAGVIDGDIVLKARGLANQRGINIEQAA